MAYKKESLEKLLNLISELIKEPENEWFKEKLINQLGINPSSSSVDFNNPSFESYFTLLKKQLKLKANYFYRSVNDKMLKKQLTQDYVKMYWYQINNDVLEMFIQAFFQMESMLNWYATNKNGHQKIKENPSFYTYTVNTNGKEFSIKCYNDFFDRSNNEISISKVSILAKIIFWAADTDNIEFYRHNYPQFTDLIKVRNENIHRNQSIKPVSEKVYKQYIKSDISKFGFYTKVLAKIAEYINVPSEIKKHGSTAGLTPEQIDMLAKASF